MYIYILYIIFRIYICIYVYKKINIYDIYQNINYNYRWGHFISNSKIK